MQFGKNKFSIDRRETEDRRDEDKIKIGLAGGFFTAKETES